MIGTLLDGLTICDVVDANNRNSVSANTFCAICIFISSPSNGDSTRFPKRPDCIISRLGMTNPSSSTNTRSVSEWMSYPCHNGRRHSHCGLPILSFTLLPLGSAVNRVPPKCFQSGVVVRGFRDFPHQGVSQINLKILKEILFCVLYDIHLTLKGVVQFATKQCDYF